MPTRSRTRFAVALALALFLSGPHRLDAQARHESPFARMRSDSVAWQMVLDFVVSRLSWELVRTAADTSAQPWRLRLPSDEPQRNLLETQLRRILRVRDVTSDDSVFETLEFGPLTIRKDTARVHVHVNETRRCAGTTRTTGSGWSTTVLVPRYGKEKVWGAARFLSTLVGDEVSCLVVTRIGAP